MRLLPLLLLVVLPASPRAEFTCIERPHWPGKNTFRCVGEADGRYQHLGNIVTGELDGRRFKLLETTPGHWFGKLGTDPIELRRIDPAQLELKLRGARFVCLTLPEDRLHCRARD